MANFAPVLMKYMEIINVHRQFMWRIRNFKNDEMNEILIYCKTHIKFAFIARKLAIATTQFSQLQNGSQQHKWLFWITRIQCHQNNY